MSGGLSGFVRRAAGIFSVSNSSLFRTRPYREEIGIRARAVGKSGQKNACSWDGRVLIKPLMEPGIMIVAEIFLQNPSEMFFGTYNYMVEALSAVVLQKNG